MRKVLLAVAVVIVAVLVVFGAAMALFDAGQFREPIRAQLEKQLGRGVTIGGVGLKLFPLSIRLDNVVIAESPKFAPNERFASIKRLSVRVGLLGLLKKQVNVESVRLVQPEVELIRNAAGEWNAATLGDPGTAGGSGGGPSIADLRIEDARVAVTDQLAKRPRTVYPRINAGLRNYGPGKKFEADADVRFVESGKQRLTAHATGPATNMDAEVSLESVSLPALLAFVGSGASGVPETTLNGKAKLQRREARVTGSGNVEVSEKRLKSPAQIDFEFAGDTEAGFWNVPSARLRVGSLAASGKGEVRTKPGPGSLSAELRTDHASVADLLQLAAAFGAAEGVTGSGTVSIAAKATGSLMDPLVEGSGTLRDAKLSTPALRKPLEIETAAIRVGKDSARFENVVASLGSMHARGSVGVQNFGRPRIEFDADIDNIDSNEIQQLFAPAPQGRPASTPLTGGGTLHAARLTYNQLTMTEVRATVSLDGGVVRLDPFSAQLFGGSQSGVITIDTRGAQNAFDVRAQLTNVDANQLLSSSTSVRQLLFGKLSGDVDVKATPQAGQDPAGALNGTVRLQLTNGRLAGVQLLNEIAGIAKFLGYTKRNETFTNIIKLAGTLRLENGVANTDDLALDFEGGSMAAAGTFGLVDQHMKMRLTTVLAKDLSQRAGGSQIGGWMSTALSNAKGELVIPALVTGTIGQPRFQPDPERMAKMKLEGLLPTRDNPQAAVSRIQGILGSLTGGKSTATPADPAQPSKKKGILDIIDSVRKQAEKK